PHSHSQAVLWSMSHTEEETGERDGRETEEETEGDGGERQVGDRRERQRRTQRRSTHTHTHTHTQTQKQMTAQKWSINGSKVTLCITGLPGADGMAGPHAHRRIHAT